MKVSVKVGSNNVFIHVTNDTTCQKLIKMALKKCKINPKASQLKTKARGEVDLYKKYSLFEQAFGIEREITNSENIFQLCMSQRVQSIQQSQFIIRKCVKSKVATQKKIFMNSRNVKKIFTVYKSKYASYQCADNVSMDSNLYQAIDVYPSVTQISRPANIHLPFKTLKNLVVSNLKRIGIEKSKTIQ